MKRFLVLDSFRGLCALAVVLHHTHATLSLTEWAFFKHAAYLVNFFFVLSGFVLYHIYADRLGTGAQLKRFVIARICRLYPLHLATLLFALLFECVKWAMEQRGIGSGSFTGARDPSEILPNLLLLQSWWSGFYQYSFNYPSWSISVEFYLYLIFALVTVLLPGLSRQVFLATATLGFVALYFKSTLFSEGALMGLGSFFAGAMTYRVYARFKDLQVPPGWATLLEALSLLTVYLAVTYSEPSQHLSLSLLFCVVIWIFAFEAGGLSRLLHTTPFKWAGARSFSIYMTHTIALFVVAMGMMSLAKITGHPFIVYVPDALPGAAPLRYIDTGSLFFDNLAVVITMTAVLGLSTLTYRYIELPGIELGKLWGRKTADNATPKAQTNEPAA
jgi:peptidoglycan/LPS O-acetylase OafA/YrhL